MSSGKTLPIDLLVPVVDGDDPANWMVWGKTLEEHLYHFYTSARYLPTDFKDIGGVRLRVLLHSEEKLHQRNAAEWKGVIGILIDSSSGLRQREEFAKRVIRVCSALSMSNDAWYKKLRFQLGLLIDEEPLDSNMEQKHIDFGHEMKLRAESVLASEVQLQLVHDAWSFASMLKTFEQQLLYVFVRNRAARIAYG